MEFKECLNIVKKICESQFSCSDCPFNQKLKPRGIGNYGCIAGGNRAIITSSCRADEIEKICKENKEKNNGKL